MTTLYGGCSLLSGALQAPGSLSFLERSLSGRSPGEWAKLLLACAVVWIVCGWLIDQWLYWSKRQQRQRVFAFFAWLRRAWRLFYGWLRERLGLPPVPEKEPEPLFPESPALSQASASPDRVHRRRTETARPSREAGNSAGSLWGILPSDVPEEVSDPIRDHEEPSAPLAADTHGERLSSPHPQAQEPLEPLDSAPREEPLARPHGSEVIGEAAPFGAPRDSSPSKKERP